jgi:hypothetical protein
MAHQLIGELSGRQVGSPQGDQMGVSARNRFGGIRPCFRYRKQGCDTTQPHQQTQWARSHESHIGLRRRGLSERNGIEQKLSHFQNRIATPKEEQRKGKKSGLPLGKRVELALGQRGAGGKTAGSGSA